MTDLNASVGRSICLKHKTKAICLKTRKPWKACDCAACVYGIDEIWPDFEHEIGQAWRLVEWMKLQNYTLELTYYPKWEPNTTARFLPRVGVGSTLGQHNNPATAICLAFCAANGIAVEPRQDALENAR